jgi:multisubunit Na+/H+ antiporter MnhG subunit
MNASPFNNFWVGAICGGILGNGAFWLVLFVIKTGWKEAMPTLRTFWRLSSTLNSVGMVAFNRSRDDYSRFHASAKSVAAYASQAKRELEIVSITLASGIQFDGLCNALRHLLEAEPSVLVTISLLNPFHQHLMQSVCSAHEIEADTMAAQIKDNLNKLSDFKLKLSQKAQNNFKIRVHNTLPIASAILIDCSENYGRIQLETKTYRTHFRNSFGFELKYGGVHPMYATLVQSYRVLVADGENYAVR